MVKYKIYSRFPGGRRFLAYVVEAGNKTEALNKGKAKNRTWGRATKSKPPMIVEVKRVVKKKATKKKKKSNNSWGGFF